MAVAAAWEALRGDPLAWLLDERRPNLHWRVLIELVGRPEDSPAVLRARGGASAAEPVATLLADLQPDGTWSTDEPWWAMGSGPGWRLLAAVQWGADPTDPRLHEASARLLADAPGEGGFSPTGGEPPQPWLTARILQALVGLGWSSHQRCQEALAWLEEAAPTSDDGGWLRGGAGTSGEVCAVTPVALLAALTSGAGDRRTGLRNRCVAATLNLLSRGRAEASLGHPNLDRTDFAEALWALARAGAEVGEGGRSALRALQDRQLQGGRWPRDLGVPAGLPVAGVASAGEASHWLTLRSAVAVLHYAVAAELPRMFPQKPS
jgi:hypothetical protein